MPLEGTKLLVLAQFCKTLKEMSETQFMITSTSL